MAFTKYGTIREERPDLLEHLSNVDDGDKYTIQSGKKVKWICPSCGKEFERAVNKAVNRNVLCKNCRLHDGCKKRRLSDKDDLTGKVFSFLRVISLCDERNPYDNSRMGLCKCVCGKTVKYTTQQLKKGTCKSCGCMKQAIRLGTGKWTKHGMSHSRLYHIWQNMKGRCLNPKNHAYHLYGGRGIRVCDEWLDFEKFALWAVSNGYDSCLSIDRIDVNGNYEPENSRFSTMKEQAFNRRTTIKITYDNETHSLSEWSRILSISRSTITKRYKDGLSIKDILFAPVTHNKHT